MKIITVRGRDDGIVFSIDDRFFVRFFVTL